MMMIFEKFSNINFHEYLSRCPVRTNIHDEANSLFMQFCELGKK